MSRSMNSIIERHFKILDYIKENHPKTQREIAEETSIPKSTVHDAVKRFERLGKIKKINENLKEVEFDNPGKYVGADYKPMGVLERKIKFSLTRNIIAVVNNLSSKVESWGNRWELIYEEPDEIFEKTKKRVARDIGKPEKDKKLLNFLYKHYKKVAEEVADYIQDSDLDAEMLEFKSLLECIEEESVPKERFVDEVHSLLLGEDIEEKDNKLVLTESGRKKLDASEVK